MLAGLRSGHLASALENLSQTARRAVELRRSMAIALIYPTIIVTLAYLLFLFSMVYLVPVVSAAYRDLTGAASPVLEFIVTLGRTIDIWGVLIPLFVAVLFLWWWYRTGRQIRSFRGGSGGGRRLLFGGALMPRLPSVRQSLRDGRMATFSELLRLLDRHQVPMPEAIVLAADASGDRGLSRAARKFSHQLRKGEVFRSRDDLPRTFPPLLGWSIASGMGGNSLDRTLATSAEMYRQRAMRSARWAAIYMPIMLTLVVGGSAVFLQAMVVFLPFVNLMYRLGMPH